MSIRMLLNDLEPDKRRLVLVANKMIHEIILLSKKDDELSTLKKEKLIFLMLDLASHTEKPIFSDNLNMISTCDESYFVCVKFSDDSMKIDEYMSHPLKDRAVNFLKDCALKDEELMSELKNEGRVSITGHGKKSKDGAK